jgi:hypothetical protein
LNSGDAFFNGSQNYEPVALLRQGDEILYVARVSMKASRQFMILTPTLGSLLGRMSLSAASPTSPGRVEPMNGTT